MVVSLRSDPVARYALGPMTFARVRRLKRTGDSNDGGATFNGVKIGQPATGALLGAGYKTLADLPDDMHELQDIHAVGPSAVRRLKAALVKQQLRSP